MHSNSRSLLLLLALLPGLLAEFIQATVGAEPMVINRIATYTFVLDRSYNPVSENFIDPIFAVPTTAYIEFKMPASFGVVSPATATPPCRNSQTGITLTCTVSEVNKLITVTGIFGITGMRNAASVGVVIEGLRNPSRAESSGNF